MKHATIRFWCALLLVCPTTLVAQKFDERMNDWPLDYRMRGAVIANGSVQASEEIEQAFRELAGGEEANIVVIQFGQASGDDGLADLEGAKYFQNDAQGTWANPESDATGEDAQNDLAKSLADATGLWIQNGDQPLTSPQLASLGILRQELWDFVKRRTVIYANRPIADQFGRHKIVNTETMPSIANGLNLMPDCVLRFDYQDDTGRATLLSVLAAHPRCVGIGVEPNTAVVLRGRIVRAIGDGQATFMLMANQREPLRVKQIKQASSRRANPYQYLVDLTAWRRDAIDRTLEPFPPAEPDKPHVENGTLMIVGGGGLPDGLMKQFVELSGGEEARLIYVPCTSRDEVSARDSRLLQAWKSEYGAASAEVLHTKDRERANSDTEFLEPLKKATGIWFGGGRQWNFSDSYYGTEAHRLMKQVLQRGGIIGGSSAGASIQARYLARANPLGNIDIMAAGYERGGLGFVSGVAIDQHFSQRGRQTDMTQLVNRYPQLLGIGIDEGTALLVRKSIGEVVGKGKVFFYDRAQHAAWDKPDYLALPAGSTYDLAERRAIEDATSDATSDAASSDETDDKR